jgi:hypothetical protein
MAISRVLIFLGILALGLVGCQQSSNPAPPTAKTPVPVPENLEKVAYTGDGFKIHMPKGWKRQEPKPGTVVVYVEEGKAANILIKRPASEKPRSLGEVFQEISEALPRALKDGKKINEGDLAIDGRPVKWLEITQVQNGQQVHQIAYLLVDGTFTYMIFCSAPEEEFEQKRSLFRNVMESFRID